MTIQGAVYELEQMLSRTDIPDWVKPTIKKVIETIVDEFSDQQAESEGMNKWIPVSEKLPEVGDEVLVCFDFKGRRSVYISNFYGDGEFHGLDDEYLTPEGRKYRKAVAWMLLPEPYKAESEDKNDC